MSSHSSASDFDERIGFVGLGNIGQPMALTLLREGFDVSVFDLREEAMEPCVDAGATAADSANEVAASSDIVEIAVRGGGTLKQLTIGPDGIIQSMDPGSLLIVHSTVTPQTILEISEHAADHDVDVIDVAVSGGDTGAAAGTLTLMIGGDEQSVARCRQIFDALGDNEFHLGTVGRGVVGKLANNLMVQCNHLVAMEAMQMADEYDIAEEDMAAVAEVSTGGSWIVENWGFYDRYLQEHTLSGTDELYFWLRSGCKHSLEAAEAKNLTLPITGLCSELRPIMLKNRYQELTAGQNE